MLNLNNLTSTRTGKSLFGELSYQLNAGEMLYVQGLNGAGKTTLLKIVSGILGADSGEVLWNGLNIHEGLEEYRSNMVYLNHHQAHKDELTVLENLEFTLNISGVFENKSILKEALNVVGLSRYHGRPFRTLSQGQKRRLSMARLIVDQSRPLWILDEPFNALDKEGVALLEDLIQKHADKGGMVILTSHLEPNFSQQSLKILRLGQ